MDMEKIWYNRGSCYRVKDINPILESGTILHTEEMKLRFLKNISNSLLFIKAMSQIPFCM